ncbi:bifunctional metallophosphatase/5'-nucleotidase [candidate division WOR-3 bacterium]|nr:bifunctional metallophosphatase/5'-nucleotidase [candidate division WOR-3 bacterium]
MKKIIFLMALSASLQAETIRVAIAATSDLQSVLVPYELKIGDSVFTVGGFSRISSFKNNLESDTALDGVFLVSSGDDFINPIYSVFSGQPEVRGMNLARYDVYCPGNHEFDNGTKMFSNAISEAEFEIVCANITFSDSALNEIVKDYSTFEIEGVKIGFFGLMTPDFFKLTNPGDSQVFMTEDIFKVAERAVVELESLGCGAVIGVTHTGFRIDSLLAENVEGIDLIIGGHDHTQYYEYVNGVALVQNGAGSQTIGTLFLTFEDDSLKVIDFCSRYLDSTVGEDEFVREEMDEYYEKYQESLSEKIGVSLTSFDTRKEVVRGKESSIGDLICDSWLYWLDETDIAFINGGSIRGDREFPPGDITYGTIAELLPFRNEIIELKMTGSQIKSVLEVSASGQLGAPNNCPDSMRASYGGFLQVGGIRFVIDTSKVSFCGVYSGRNLIEIVEPGERISEVEVFEDGKWLELELDGQYTVIVSDWIAGGGDGHYVFLDSSLERESTSIYAPDPLLNFILEKGEIEFFPDGRIKVK